MPAGSTPTEIYKAWQSGADCVKIFPCDAMGGAKYLKAIKSIFPQILMMPTGGISLETVGELLKAGAFAVGVGSDLVDLKAISAGEAHVVIEKTAQFVKIINEANL
jgi:2-dehydro-3-deoxyphosphogluconate aldolase/(4S)-4-hydroxy-2-oxoglutarate aldolase